MLECFRINFLNDKLQKSSTNPKEKGNPYLPFAWFKILASDRGSVWVFDPLVLLNFRQCSSVMPQKFFKPIHHQDPPHSTADKIITIKLQTDEFLVSCYIFRMSLSFKCPTEKRSQGIWWRWKCTKSKINPTENIFPQLCSAREDSHGDSICNVPTQ